jgi:acetyl esterase/lipase
MTGFCVAPRPAVLVSLWGYGDPTADWESRPSEHYRKGRLVTKEEAWTSVGTRPIADGFNGGRKRGRFYLYCRQQGRWPEEVVGLDPRAQDREFAPYCPVRNVSKEYPPTLFIHGTADTDVPHAQSVQMDAELARQGVEHRLISIPKAGHGVGDGDRKLVAEAYAAAFEFVERHVRPH